MSATTAVLVKIFIVQLQVMLASCQYENNYGYYGSYPGYYDYSQAYQYLQSGSFASYGYPSYQYASTSYEAPQQTQSIVIINNDSKEDNCCSKHHGDPIFVPYPVPIPVETKCDCGCSEDHLYDDERKYYDSDCKHERGFIHPDCPSDRRFSYFEDEDCHVPFWNTDYEFEYSSCPCSKTREFDFGCHSKRKNRSRSHCKDKIWDDRYKKESSCKYCDRSERRRCRD